MIQVNLMEAADAALRPKAAKPVKASKPQAIPAAPAGRSRPWLLVMALLIAVGTAVWFYRDQGYHWIEYFLNAEAAVAELPALPPPPPAPPQIVAQPPRPALPAVPSNGAVEEIVRTVRPELFIKSARTEYRELLPTEKVRYQKKAFQVLMNAIYTMTPDNVGFLDLAFKAPDYYYMRGMASDPQSQSDFLSRLKSASRDMKTIGPESGTPAPEFSVYGTLPVAGEASGEAFPLVPAGELNKEILALRDLSIAASVRLTGLDKPVATPYGAYKRIVLRTTTPADFPALVKFSELLRQSPLRVGILQFAARPTLSGGMSSTLEFVIYTVP